MSEQLWSIPNHWSWVKASEIAKIVGGGTPKSHDETNFSENGIPWITPADLTGYDKKYISRGRRDLSQKGLETSGARLLPKGSVLFSSRAPIGYCVIAENPISTNQGFKSLVLNENALPEYIQYYLIATREYAKSIASGTTFLELSGSRMAHYPIPLPPLEEQRRIVAKLDVLLGRNKAGRQELSAATQLIKRQRQAVLAQAFSGELTADWREERGLEETNSWKIAYIQDLLSKKRVGMKTGPFGTALKKEDYQSSGIPIIGIENIGRMQFIHGSKKFISEQKANALKEYDVKAGDILISRSGTVGEVCVAPENIGEARISTNLIRVSLDDNIIEPSFFGLQFIGSLTVLDQVSALCAGTTRDFLNQKILSSIEFPLPSLEEQREIVRRIEAAFARIDEGEQAIKQAFTLAERLEQATLAKAFRGEL